MFHTDGGNAISTTSSLILHLQWSQVDFERKLVHITNVDGFTTKSGRCRTIAISEAVIGLFQRIRQRANGSAYVFNRQEEKLNQSYVEHKFKKHLREVGLSDKLNFHSLRYTFATSLVEQSASIYEVQRLLGHSDIKTTQIYAHLAASELHATVNRISFQLSTNLQTQERVSAQSSVESPR